MFGSKLAAVLAMAGSAIGLGNIWRFPYMVGQNGGAAFIIVYLVSALLLSMPIFLSESIIGRTAHKGTFSALRSLAPGSKWHWAGFITVITPLILVSYYSVVGGWSLHYSVVSIERGFAGREAGAFGSFISGTWAPLCYHTIFLGICAAIVSAGVKKGIERFNKLVMPVLFVLMIVITVYAVCLPGAMEGVRYLIKPDFSKLTAQGISAAMGQSFFSLSLGVGTILTYSSYLHSDEDILSSGLGTAGFDLLFALIAGFAVMPAVFAAGIEPGAGPGLVFDTLPFIFGKMGETLPILSRIVSILFFVSLLFAAITSAISMIEVGVAFLVEEKKMNRGLASVLVFGTTWFLGIFCSLSFGPMAGFQIDGRGLFDFLDHMVSDYLMSFGGLLFTIFVGWRMGREEVRRDFTNNGTRKLNNRIFNTVYFLIRYVAPVGITVIFITNLIF